MIDLLARLTAWTYRRQYLDASASSAAAALDDLVGVYSSHPTAPLSLANRVAGFGARDLPDVERRRVAIRLPAMRASIFLIPTARAATIFGATRWPMARHARRLEVAQLDWAGYERLKPIVIERLSEPRTPDELQRGLETDARLMTVIRMMALEGLVLRLSTSLRGDALRYVATVAWLGAPLDAEDPAAARAWLAGAYLRAFGPARVADVAWWAGLPRRDAAVAVAAVETVDVGGGLLLPADLADAFAATESLDPDAVALLPKWDPYTMGFAGDGRQRLLDGVALAQAYSGVGDGLPLILRGGRAVATWSHRFDGDRMTVRVAPLAGARWDGSIQASTFEAVGEILGARTVRLTESVG